MALGEIYPAEIIDGNGNISKGVELQFTDDTNQPASGSSPIIVPDTGETPIVEQAPDTPILSYDADAGAFNVAPSLAMLSGFTSGGGAVKTADDASLGFYGTSPQAKPVVPLTTPSAQDIIDALLALGLVSQSD